MVKFLNLGTLNVKNINISNENGFSVNGQKTQFLVLDPDNNICISPNSFSLNTCYGKQFFDSNSIQKMTGMLNINGMIQLSFGSRPTETANNLGKIGFFKDKNDNYRLWICEEWKYKTNIKKKKWKPLTGYWIEKNNNIYINDGFVGIGTLDPKAKLHINGNILIENGTLRGNASTATTLQNNRLIAGQAFNGSKDITIKINDLSDITLSSPSQNQILSYNGTQWINTSTFTGSVTGLPNPINNSDAATKAYVDNNSQGFEIGRGLSDNSNVISVTAMDENENYNFPANIRLEKDNFIFLDESNDLSYIKGVLNGSNTDIEMNTTGNVVVGNSSNLVDVEIYGNLRFPAASINNLGFGFESLKALTSGTNNVSLGYQSLSKNTSGLENIAIGQQTLQLNVSGNDNVAIGDSALQKSSTSNNVAVGAGSLFSNTTGKGNTGVGFQALESNKTGSYNTAIGYKSGVSNSNNITNATTIGANSKSDRSNSIILGDGTINVGIGKNNPTSTLHVNGSVQIDNGSIAFSTTGTITNLSNPTDPNDATNKAYVDAFVSGLMPKEEVKYATTANIAITGLQSIDGTTVSNGDRILVKNQTNSIDNGVYIARSGVWDRASDFANGKDVSGHFVFVEEGTENSNTGWVVEGSDIIVGTNPIEFFKFSYAGEIQTGNGLTKNGNTLSVNGVDANGNYTFPGNIDVSSGTITGNVTGNADTATTLQNSRSIAGQTFNGSQDITIAANDLSDITLSSPSTNQILSYNGSNWVNTSTFEGNFTGNADTATTLQNSRSIAGQTFNGSQDITIAANDLSDITLSSPSTNQILSYNGSNWVNTSTFEGNVNGASVTASTTIKVETNSGGNIDTVSIGKNSYGGSLKIENSVNGAPKWEIFNNQNKTLDFTVDNDQYMTVNLDGDVHFLNNIDVSSGTITGNVTGNADTATTLKNSRSIAGKTFNGSQDITIAINDLSDITLSSPSTNQILSYNGSNWVNTDTFEGNFTGNASTATTLQNSRSIAGKTFNGSQDITIATNDLSDITLSSPSTYEILTYDGSNWINTKTLNGINVTGLSNPSNINDAATKGYVDSHDGNIDAGNGLSMTTDAVSGKNTLSVNGVDATGNYNNIKVLNYTISDEIIIGNWINSSTLNKNNAGLKIKSISNEVENYRMAIQTHYRNPGFSGSAPTLSGMNLAIQPYSGYVGIGTGSNPAEYLVHIGQGDQTKLLSESTKLLDNQEPDWSVKQQNNMDHISLYVEGGVVSTDYFGCTFTTSSDLRIKTDINEIDTSFALQKVNEIISKEFIFKDPNYNVGINYGFIAQEVEKKLPNITKNRKEFLPSYMKDVENHEWIKINDTNKYKFIVNNLHAEHGNLRYKFYVSNKKDRSDEKKYICTSLKNEANTFIFNEKYNNVFLYGEEVKDFKVLDYNKIFTLHHGAIQELTKQLELEKEKNKQLTSDMSSLRNRLEKLEAKIK